MTREARALLADLRAREGARLDRLVAVSLVAALAEGAGLLLLVPVLASASEAGRGALPDWLPALPGTGTLLLLFLLVMTLRALLVEWRGRLRTRLAQGYPAGLREAVADALLRIGWREAELLGPARLQRLLQHDVTRSATAAAYVEQVIVTAFIIGVQGAIALFLSPALTLTAVALALASMAVGLPFLRASQRAAVGLTTLSGLSVDEAHRLRAGLKAALAEGRTSAFLDRYAARLAAERDAYVAIDDGQIRAATVAQLVAAASLVALLYAGLFLFDLAPALLILLVILFARLYAPLRALLDAWQGIAVNAPGFAELSALLAQASAAPAPVPLSGDAPADWRRLEASGLVAGIADGIATAPVDLALERGSWTALVAPSGTGKSLVLDTIAGLVPPLGGSITLDGQLVDLTRHDGWAAGLAYVGQDDLLLGDTPRAMLGLDAGAPDARVDALLDALGLSALRSRFGPALDRPLGEHGATLSGGERQRLALARALLRRPRLLILDEATAALDLEAEAALVANIRRMAPDLTALMVSHRPQSQALADRIVTLNRQV
ncbi:ATP-binding cassette domain-containing protein [Sphingomicrobium aestuariivivum]|uniref:ATP-binding cassette domain-containing protein n=1 Tax=Sphingomicrobium aestuariivivum TaxID=1582356 RepID=UPI001FD72055|nr:ABC transporter ATP-binding protein [Sphingomicrobium aestuariivivum]MCJ8191367.1 ABC transporter ATP-binding protein/permease [Sphingomicrobium aestuariivivum]